jgi:hypothetical protein
VSKPKVHLLRLTAPLPKRSVFADWVAHAVRMRSSDRPTDQLGVEPITLCGAWIDDPKRLTEDINEVTCANCLSPHKERQVTR